jgi:hypothetical protein
MRFSYNLPVYLAGLRHIDRNVAAKRCLATQSPIFGKPASLAMPGFSFSGR